MKGRRLSVVLTIILAVALSVSCAQKERKALSQLDTPEHHTFTGIKLMNQEKYVDADREFDLAIQLSAKYSKAYAGKGLVKAYQGDFENAFDSMKKASKYAETKDEEVFAHIGMGRLYTMQKEKDNWLDKAEKEFKKAIKINKDSAPAYHFLGVAYKNGLQFEDAGLSFAKVLDLNKEYMEEANAEWKVVQKIQRAMPGSTTGKKIGLVDRITRADIAALFMEELKIDELYNKKGIPTFDTAFKDPEKYKLLTSKPAFTANDIENHTLKADIEGVLKVGVRGLEVFPDGSYHPDDLITRAGYALMIEDILIKVSGDEALATKFIGATSPFPDLRSDLPYFNSAMVVTTRGIMEAFDLSSGAFMPLGTVSGADALLIIRKLKEELRYL
ncbi:MAG: tetratricopeptide repeat protein [Deltaproteobacteria bacterium]|nr:tetratricopeptide repeat protein [Deltaproteobacteria bacterium]